MLNPRIWNYLSAYKQLLIRLKFIELCAKKKKKEMEFIFK